jgi:hypothetical protein
MKYKILLNSQHHNHIAVSTKFSLSREKIFIFDNSGATPDETDDGPMWIDHDYYQKRGQITVNDEQGIYGPGAYINVTNDTGGSWQTHVDLEGALLIGKRMGLRVVLQHLLFNPSE